MNSQNNTKEKIALEVSREHGMKAKAVLEKKYGPDPYKALNVLSVASRRAAIKRKKK